MNQDIHEGLLAPFDDSDIEWRLQWVNDEKTSGIAVPYVTNRAIQYRLDKVAGFGNWKNEYIPWHSADKKASQLCGISIYFAERNEWVTKYDGAEDSDIEPVKGGLSDSMKRAAVQWGVGRYLYGIDAVFVEIEQRGRTPVIKRSEAGKLGRAHQEHIQKTFGVKPEPINTPDKASAPAAPDQRRNGPRALPSAGAAPKNCVWVEKIAVVPAPSGEKNTNLQIRDAGGKTTEVFLKGEHPELSPGAALVHTRFSKKESQGVVFHVLESFELAGEAA